MNVRHIILFVYLVMGITLFQGIPRNEYTLPYIVLLMIGYLFGLVLVLGYHYIIPTIKKSWRLGECTVYQKKYVICRKTGATEYTGYVFLKLIPEQPIGDMPKERRESLLQSTQGILAGIHHELMVAYVAVKDRYGENIKKRLQAKRDELLHMPFQSRAMKDMIERIDRELRILDQQPVILEGYYIAQIRIYGDNPYKMINELDTLARALSARLSGIGLHSKVIEGEELNIMLSMLLFGSVTQLSFPP